MTQLLRLQTIRDPRGNLTVAEKLEFPIRRAYWLHGIDTHAKRGGHAHRKLHRLMIAAAGSFQVTYRTKGWQDIRLDTPEWALVIPPLVWIELNDFAPGSTCLVLASEEHDEADCIRDFTEFVRLTR
jgi:hypothetical protein